MDDNGFSFSILTAWIIFYSYWSIVKRKIFKYDMGGDFWMLLAYMRYFPSILTTVFLNWAFWASLPLTVF